MNNSVVALQTIVQANHILMRMLKELPGFSSAEIGVLALHCEIIHLHEKNFKEGAILEPQKLYESCLFIAALALRIGVEFGYEKNEK